MALRNLPDPAQLFSPMPGSTPTVRSLAAELELSRSTISLALRDSPLIKAATRKRVQLFAARKGYRLNPLTSSLMSNLKRGSVYRGELAIVSTDETDRPVRAKCFRQLLREGATLRASELGYDAQHFVVGHGGVSLARLGKILVARGIQGVLVFPVWREPDFTKLDWSRYAGVYTDYLIEQPALHTVCADIYRSMLDVLKQIKSLGYRRPGLFIGQPAEERLQYCWSGRWVGAFLGFQNTGAFGNVPPLVEEVIDRQVFARWFKRFKPDVVIGHLSEAVDWMADCGARVPETHGFVSLNIALQERPCAGLDLQPKLLAMRGIELLTAQILRRESGLAGSPSATMIPGKWIDGPTLKRRSGLPA